MKIFKIAALAALAGGFSQALAFEEQPAMAEPAPVQSSAHIIGDIPDGTPPPPEPPKPKFIVPAKDVLETKTIQQGGRTITVRRITPIALPPKAKTAPPLDIDDPAIQKRMAEAREESSAEEFLCAGASVFRPDDAAPRSLVNIWPQGKREPVVFWSSADFGFISGIGTFTGSDGATRSLFLMWSETEVESQAALQHELGPDAPAIPEFPQGKATYQIVSGKPSPETLVTIQSIHDVYNNEYQRLKTAYEGRKKAQRLREAELKANPPKPKDIVLNYWRTDSKAQPNAKGPTR